MPMWNPWRGECWKMIKERYIALLRGINISGKNKVPMANLKKSFEALGWSHLPVNARFNGFSVFALVMLHLQMLEERYLVNTFGAPY